MQIEKIKINDLEAELLIGKIIAQIDFSNTKQKILIDFHDINCEVPEGLINIETTFEIYAESYTESETNAEIITLRNIHNFRCDFFYDGVGIEVQSPVDIEDKIEKYVYI